MFPVSNSSQTIIDCFQNAVKKLKIDVLTNYSVQELYKTETHWKISTSQEVFTCEKVVMASGSNPKIWELLQNLGHSIIEPVPSLFTFNIKDPRIKELMGLSAMASVKVKKSKLEASGPLLITHWGMSGPGILRLSAWGARELAEKKYQFAIQVNWLNEITFEESIDLLKDIKDENAKKLISKYAFFDLPKRLWENLVKAAGISDELKWADINKNQINAFAEQLINGEFHVNGKSTFKEEFVTAGGIDLKEVNFKTMESKILPNVYFAGEILNIDAITGGFNFQNAWTGGFIVAENIVK
jgi:predicted Rossmann fold flavoprotein